MPRPRKSTEESFYDVFSSWPLSEQKIALRVMERLVIEREKEERRAVKSAKGEFDAD
jgi:hypothetical protein